MEQDNQIRITVGSLQPVRWTLQELEKRGLSIPKAIQNDLLVAWNNYVESYINSYTDSSETNTPPNDDGPSPGFTTG